MRNTLISLILIFGGTSQVFGKEFVMNEMGIKCDGRTDVSNDINRVFSIVRYLANDRTRADLVVLPSGDCLIESPIDLTYLKEKSLIVEGKSTRLLGAGIGTPVINAIGSEFLLLNNISIVGLQNKSPMIGLLIGRSSDTMHDNADNIQINNLKTSGYFSLAAVYNLNSETTTFFHAVLVNESLNPHSFVLIQDGINHFNLKSSIAQISAQPDVAQSFNENLFINCDIRHNGFGIPIWLSHPVRHSFIRSYVAALHANTAVVIFASLQNQAPVMLALDVHFEGQNLTTAIRFENSDNDLIIKGLTLVDQYVGAKESIFAQDTGSVSVQDANIEIADARETTVLLKNPERWKLSGRVYVGRESLWNAPIENFQGLLEVQGKMHFRGQQ